jgi:hypothetical protein
MLRKGDLVRPVVRLHCYLGGTLAIVITTDGRTLGKSIILWLNGGFRGTKTWDYLDMFEKVTERNKG